MQSACIASERDKLIPWYPVPLFVATTLRCRLSLFFQVDEKWNALVRYRKAVNAHTLEVTRLQNLLKVAQGGEDRSRLTSELEQVSSKFNLESMEDSMHMEVRYVRAAHADIDLSVFVPDKEYLFVSQSKLQSN